MGKDQLGGAPQLRVSRTNIEKAMKRVRIGSLELDVLRRADALDAVLRLVREGRGGTVFTPNVDHIVQAEHNAEFRQAYADTSLSFVDGTPVLWAARLLGTPLPEKL